MRTYIFFPLSGRLMRSKLRRYPLFIILIAHLTTMAFVGLWHGFTLNFALWGLWHGAGLFGHKIYSDYKRRVPMLVSDQPGLQRVRSLLGWIGTFTFVILGWVFFALPDFSTSISIFKLLGNLK